MSTLLGGFGGVLALVFLVALIAWPVYFTVIVVRAIRSIATIGEEFGRLNANIENGRMHVNFTVAHSGANVPTDSPFAKVGAGPLKL